MTTEVTEILSDLKAYLSVGETGSAVPVLFEALRAASTPQAQMEIGSFMIRFSLSLWQQRKFGEAKSLANEIIETALRATGDTIDADYLDLYTTALAETGSSPLPVERMFRQRNLIRLFEEAGDLETGDIAECGCAKGNSSLQLALAYARRHPGWQGEGLHIFDSFAGLSEPRQEDVPDPAAGNEFLATMMQRGRFAAPLEVVSRNLHGRFPRVELHAGWIPDVFSGEPERRYRFVHVDVDLYQPTRDSLAYFFPRLVEGAIVLTDDYSWPGARKAFDEFCRQNALELLKTETDQAYFVKDGPR